MARELNASIHCEIMVFEFSYFGNDEESLIYGDSTEKNVHLNPCYKIQIIFVCISHYFVFD